MLSNIGSQAAILSLPWTIGSYRLTFQRRLIIFSFRKPFCVSPKCLFIQRPISSLENCGFNFIVTYFKQDIPLHTWHFNDEFQSLPWLSKPETLFKIGIDFDVTGNYVACSGINASQPVKLYFLHLPMHHLSEAEQVYNALAPNCHVKVDQCRFGKCYHFN